MKRLTIRDEKGIAIACRDGCMGGPACFECERKVGERLADIEDVLGEEYDLDQLRDLVAEATDLAAYEDTRLEPEEIELMKEAQEIGENMAPQRLAEVLKAEQDGRLVVIPAQEPGENAVLAAVFRGDDPPVVMHGGGDLDDLIALTHLLVSYAAEVGGVDYAAFCQGLADMTPTTGFKAERERREAKS